MPIPRVGGVDGGIVGVGAWSCRCAAHGYWSWLKLVGRSGRHGHCVCARLFVATFGPGSYSLVPKRHCRDIGISVERYNSNMLDLSSDHARKLQEDDSSNYCY